MHIDSVRNHKLVIASSKQRQIAKQIVHELLLKLYYLGHQHIAKKKKNEMFLLVGKITRVASIF